MRIGWGSAEVALQHWADQMVLESEYRCTEEGSLVVHMRHSLVPGLVVWQGYNLEQAAMSVICQPRHAATNGTSRVAYNVM